MAIFVFDIPLQTWTGIGQTKPGVFSIIRRCNSPIWTRTSDATAASAGAAVGLILGLFSDFALNANVVTFFMATSMTSMSVTMTSMMVVAIFAQRCVNIEHCSRLYICI